MPSQGFLGAKRARQWGWNMVASVTLMLLCDAENVCTSDGQQCDAHVRCPVWKEEGECIRSQSYMEHHCPGSCDNWIENDVRISSRDDTSEGTCLDRHADCALWAVLGECESNFDVKEHCAVSCGTCPTEPNSDVDNSNETCVDDSESCEYWASVGECDSNPNYMQHYCKKSCDFCHLQVATTNDNQKNYIEQEKATSFGIRQRIDGARSDEVVARLLESIAYMESETVLQLDESTRAKCQNQEELCTFWAVHGECELNPNYMQLNCAPSCMTCHHDDPAPHCPGRDATAKPALYPGDLNKMFQRIVNQAPGNRTDVSTITHNHTMPNYTVQVHSQPLTDADASTPPWVITLDDFLTEEECTIMIQLGFKHEYHRSNEVTDGEYDVIQSDYRTSENTWCTRSHGCRNETIPARLHQRMADVLSIPPENCEDIQILKYEVGQY